MACSRREFLKIAGISGLGLCLPFATGLIEVATSSSTAANPALKARRWAMAVNISRCKAECADCITACHLEHNVPVFADAKDSIRWISSRPYPVVFPGVTQPRPAGEAKPLMLPVLCNHCDNPPCVRVCPTGATFKRADGITMMDYHRCIGCRFCMAACPYGSRSMNYRDPRPFISKLNPAYPPRTTGVVEKCNFCEERLARGMLPACVTACRQKALVFGDIKDADSEIRRALNAGFSLRRRPELGTDPQIHYIL